MKVIPLSEAKARLSEYAHRCHDEPVVVTVNGRPAFQLVPLKEGDDLMDRLIEHHPGFWRLLQRRLGERSVAAGEAARRLGSRRPARRSARRRARG
jgi:prevent-host-death family protein